MSRDFFLSRPRNHVRSARIFLAVLAAGFANAGHASAMTAPGDVVRQSMPGLTPYTAFVAGLKVPVAAVRAVPPGASPADEARSYLLGLYDGVAVAHSFVRGGQVYDCFAVADQPSVRLRGETVAEPPPFAPPRSPAGLSADDTAGSGLACAVGSVPIRRITPDEIARFGSLRRFLSKDASAADEPARPNAVSPDAAAAPDLSGRWIGTETEPGAPVSHLNIALALGAATASGGFLGDSTQSDANSVKYYAYANLSGKIAGNSVTFQQNKFYLQKAAPGTHWCLSRAKLTYAAANGNVTLTGTLQAAGCKPATVKLTKVLETHKYATRYQAGANLGGSSSISLWKPTLNPGAGQIFSLAQQWYAGGSGPSLQTAEVGWQEYPGKYRTFNPVMFIYWTADDYNKTGCYNTDCPGFVLTDSSFVVGGMFTKYGPGPTGAYAITVGYYLYKGAWWLAYGGKWVGYYPVSLYRGGAMAKAAASIQYGGETVGATSWPAMGSGRFASQANAAFHENISYYNLSGKLISATLPIPTQPSPRCYTVSADIRNKGSFFYFGGPGGKGC